MPSPKRNRSATIVITPTINQLVFFILFPFTKSVRNVGSFSNFDDPRISGVIKDHVKAEQRMVEDFILGTFLAFTRRMACLKDKPFEKKISDLMMMSVFVGFAEIFLRVLIERPLTTK